MIDKIKRFSLITNMLKATSIYAVGDVIARAVPFILLPVLTRFLTPQDYGVLAIFMAIFSVVQIIISMGAGEAIIRAYFDIGKSKFSFPKYVFNGVFMIFLMAVVISFFWWVGKPYFLKTIPVPFKYQLAIPLLSFFTIVYMIVFKMWIFMKKSWLFTIFNSVNISLELGVAVFLIVVMGFNWQGRVWGIVVSRLILFIIAIYVLLKYNFLRVSFNKVYIGNILSFGFPVVLHSLGFAVIAAIDRFFIEKFVNISSAGIYSASYSICSIIGFISGSFNLAWAPIFYEKLKDLSAISKIKLVKFTYLYFALVILAVILFIKFIPGILHILVGSKFQGVSAFIPWLALGFSFHSMYVMVVNYVFYAKETKILSKIAFITVILSFVSNYILIKINGAIGVAQATCLVFLIRFLLVWFFSNKVYPMPWFSFARIRQTG